MPLRNRYGQELTDILVRVEVRLLEELVVNRNLPTFDGQQLPGEPHDARHGELFRLARISFRKPPQGIRPGVEHDVTSLRTIAVIESVLIYDDSIPSLNRRFHSSTWHRVGRPSSEYEDEYDHHEQADTDHGSGGDDPRATPHGPLLRLSPIRLPVHGADSSRALPQEVMSAEERPHWANGVAQAHGSPISA